MATVAPTLPIERTSEEIIIEDKNRASLAAVGAWNALNGDYEWAINLFKGTRAYYGRHHMTKEEKNMQRGLAKAYIRSRQYQQAEWELKSLGYYYNEIVNENPCNADISGGYFMKAILCQMLASTDLASDLDLFMFDEDWKRYSKANKAMSRLCYPAIYKRIIDMIKYRRLDNPIDIHVDLDQDINELEDILALRILSII